MPLWRGEGSAVPVVRHGRYSSLRLPAVAFRSTADSAGSDIVCSGPDGPALLWTCYHDPL